MEKPNRLIPVLAVFLLTALVCGEANARSVYDAQGRKLDFSFEAGMGVFAVRNANLGGGRDRNPATRDAEKIDWREYYLMPKLNASQAAGASDFYGEWAVTATATRGDGDARGATTGPTDDLATETFILGWKSGKALSGLGDDALDLYAGKGRITIADGFVVGDGSLDSGRMGCYWLAPHSSFRQVAALKINTKPVRGDLFFLATDATQADTRGYGANIEYRNDSYGTVGGMFLYLDKSKLATRDGLSVAELRYLGNPLTMLLDHFYLNGELALENNPSSKGKVEAHAWALEGGYTLPFLETTLSLRFAGYSGDRVSSAKTNEGYDPLFQKAFGRGWGTWLEGEAFGEYLLGNTNKQSITAAVKLKPSASVATGLLYYTFDADIASFGGTHLVDTHLGSEVDLYLDWTLSDSLFLSFAAGRAIPGKGLEKAGYKDDTTVFDLTAILSF